MVMCSGRKEKAHVLQSADVDAGSASVGGQSTLPLISIESVETARRFFIASNGPVSKDQVRQKMTADGWSNVLIMREGR
jgi:hypothetical protein